MMPTSRCPVIRPQAAKYGPKVNDYHSFQGNRMSAICRHCGQTRRQAQSSQHDRFWGEDMDAAAGRPPPHERFDSVTMPTQWTSIIGFLKVR
jgi:hypothetical protein